MLLIGAGGAAAGALGPLLEPRPGALVRGQPQRDKAQALVERHARWPAARRAAAAPRALDDCGSGFDVVINATASSLQGAAVRSPAAVLRARRAGAST